MSENSLWTWGYNLHGELGVEDLIHRSSPVQVGSLSNWSSVAGGKYHCASVKIDGTLWTWGLNEDGELGLGDAGAGTERSSPVQIGGDTNWSSVDCGRYHTIATRVGGSLWDWGDNQYGQLGQGDEGVGTDRSSPVQVGSDTDWKSAAAGGSQSLALQNT